MKFIDEHGREIILGSRLTTPGGEGIIYRVDGDSSRVAKIYHQAPSDEGISKLKLLRSLATNDILEVAAWPSDLLYDGARPGILRGFLMPFVDGKEIHRLYGPHDRYTDFPNAAWDFLIHVAKNAAAAFETLHEHGVVMGDVNEKNLLVTSHGYVRLIDCDSYQFSNADGVFHCGVGVPLWTPPELQGRDFRSLVRTRNHDRFGLALLVFQLLFMGRHPYAGVPDRPEQFEIESAIAKFLFAFTPKSRPLGIRPPPHALPLGVLPVNIVNLFERAFLRGSEGDSARPSGQEWFRSLDLLSRNLRVCSRDPGHKYPSTETKCPWCEIFDAGGPNFFINVVVSETPRFPGSNVAAFWTAIQNVRVRPLMAKSRLQYNVSRPIGTPLPTGIIRTSPQFYIGCIIIIASVPMFWVVGCLAAAGVFIGWLLVADGSETSEYKAEKLRRQTACAIETRKVREALSSAESIVADYQRQFACRKIELQAAFARYNCLDKELAEALKGLELRKRELQLNEYLDNVLIRDHEIPEIKAKRKLALKAYGIESAFDISYSMNVPGFGRHLVSLLLGWRHQCESRFRYNPTLPLPQKEIHEVNLRFGDLRRGLEIELRGGARSLEEIGVVAERKLRECESHALESIRREAQAEADLSLFV